MIEEILPDLYKIEVPLPKNPLKTLNSYVIKTKDRNLIIDTGMNRKECLSAMHSGLTELDVDLNKTDFFITHLHADHLGLVSHLATETSKVYFNQPDRDVIVSGSFIEDMLNFVYLSGFPEKRLKEAFEKHPAIKYSPRGPIDFTILREGDLINIGDYQFECIETPGHTKGHICLFESRKKIFVSGDHILNDITPNISLWSDKENPLHDFLTSLDKVYGLDIELILPGHRRLFRDSHKRIQELKYHHQLRGDEVLSILAKGGKDTYQVASKMSWDINCDSWDQFPIMQQWFATGEAAAHLKYLEKKGLVQREMKAKRAVFSLK